MSWGSPFLIDLYACCKPIKTATIFYCILNIIEPSFIYVYICNFPHLTLHAFWKFRWLLDNFSFLGLITSKPKETPSCLLFFIAQVVTTCSGILSYPFDTVRRRMMMQYFILFVSLIEFSNISDISGCNLETFYQKMSRFFCFYY